MQLLILLFLINFSLAFEGLRIPVKQNFLSKDTLIQRQKVKLNKLSSKHGSKFLGGLNTNDYLTVDISLGTPWQNFTFMLSTGSSRAWVFGDSASKSSKSYKANASSTSKNLKSDFNQIDSLFNVSSHWYSDVFRLGKEKLSSQSFGVVYNINEPEDATFPVDGLLGLSHFGPDTYKGGEPKAPIDNLLAPLVMRFYMLTLNKQVPPSKGRSGGALTIGYINTDDCDTYYSLSSFSLGISNNNRCGIWIKSIGYGYGNQMSLNNNAFFDSSISNIMLPYDALLFVYNFINPIYDFDLGVYTVKCSSARYLRDFNFREYYSGDINYIDSENYVVDLDLDDGKCALAIDAVDGDYDEDKIVFGTPIYRQFCIKHDLHDNILTLYYRGSIRTTERPYPTRRWEDFTTETPYPTWRWKHRTTERPSTTTWRWGNF